MGLAAWQVVAGMGICLSLGALLFMVWVCLRMSGIISEDEDET